MDKPVNAVHFFVGVATTMKHISRRWEKEEGWMLVITSSLDY